MIDRIRGVLVVGLLAATWTCAQDNPFADRVEIDRSLLGTYHFGVYLEDQNIGTYRFDVEATTVRPDATYTVKGTAGMSFGPSTNKVEQTDHLGADLSLVHSKSVEHRNDGGQETLTDTEVRLDGTIWRWTEVENGTESTATLEYSAPLYAGPGNYLVVAMSLPLDDDFSGLSLASVDWEAQTATGTAALADDTTIEARPWSDFDFRGETVRVRVFLFTSPGTGNPMNVAVTEEHKVIAFWPENAPVKMISGTEEQCSANLAVPEREPQPEMTPTAAATVYLKVLAKVEPLDRLDDIVDWDAAYEQIVAIAPDAQGLTPETLRALMRAQLGAAEAPYSPEDVATILPGITEKITDDRASVDLAGQGRIELRQREDGSWVIVEIPQ